MQGRNVVLAIFVALTIVFASFLVLETSMVGSQKTTTVTVTESQQTKNTTLWQVLKDNITLYGETACMAINFGALGGCPSPIPYGNGTLTNVELISHNGTEYYAVTFPPVTNQGMPGSEPVTYTVWFTNSTIFCTSPPLEFPALITAPCP